MRGYSKFPKSTGLVRMWSSTKSFLKSASQDLNHRAVVYKAHKSGRIYKRYDKSCTSKSRTCCFPEKFTTNISEKTNSLLQEFLSQDYGKKKVEKYFFALSVEKLVKGQKQEVELAVVGRD